MAIEEMKKTKTMAAAAAATREKKKHTAIVDECQQDKCYMKSVLTHMECDVRCDAKEKYTFYAKNVNDGAGRSSKKVSLFIFISQAP